MSFRRKIFLLCLALLITASVLAVGSFHMFLGMGNQMEALQETIGIAVKHIELEEFSDRLILLLETWVATGDTKYKDESMAVLEKALSASDELRSTDVDQIIFDDISMDLKELKIILVSISDDPGVLDFATRATEIQALAGSIIESVEEVHDSHIRSSNSSIEASKKYRSGLTSLMGALVAICVLIVGALIVMVGRAMGEPYAKLLEATEQVASGDLLFRIRGKESDSEFRLIADRFNHMVESLHASNKGQQNRISQTELLLEASRLYETLDDIIPSMGSLVRSVAGKLGYDACIILRSHEMSPSLRVLASSSGELSQGETFALDTADSGRLFDPPMPVRIFEGEGADQLLEKMRDSDFLLVPMTAEHGFVMGFIALFGGSPDLDEDNNDTFMLLSTIVGTALRNADLQGETRNILKTLTLINDLSRAITSVYDPRELVESLASRIAMLTSSKRCVVRVIDGEVLKVISFHGPLDHISMKENIPLGKGIAGWVAKEGRPLLVENSGDLSSDMNYPPLSSRTAISVPLEKEGKIIGVLGVYDKFDEQGNEVAFTTEDLFAVEGLASISAVALERSFIQEKHERVMLEKELSENRLDLLFESVQGGIVTLDRDFIIRSANNYIERWSNIPLEQIVGKSALDIFHSKDGICPHCAAKGTFEEGGVNSITQSFGLNYAELSSYPSIGESGEVSEAVVFIQDITDRVLYQEEIMGLYREVVQNKEYIESLISNSADAIITTDLDGNVISWNPSAEKIYGYTKDDLEGKPVPFIPPNLVDIELENSEKIRKGDVVNTETFRVRKDGSLIEASLTMSPIKDASGEIIGMSSISRDITARKRVEKELIRRNQELSRLFLISSAARGTMDLDVLIRMILSAVTMGDGLGFNRAILFLPEKEHGVLRAYLGVGPATSEEAYKIWADLSHQKMTLQETLRSIETGEEWTESFLDKIEGPIDIPLDGDTVLARVAREKKPYVVEVGKDNLLADKVLIEKLGTGAYAGVPLVSRDKVIGVIWVDNKFTMRSITVEDIRFLIGFSDQVASAIENARLFQKVSQAEAELENIFSSISDMVFLADKDCTIKSVNQAVVDKIGLPREKIVGKKCYRIFHGTEEPLPSCPHHKTLEDLKPYIKEVEDHHLKGTFITSTAPMFNVEKDFIGTVHVMRDVTEINELKSRLLSSEKMAALGEVAAKVAHEIRNPLVSVGGFAKRLESGLEGTHKEFASIISNEVGRLEQILREILGFVREVRQNRIDVNLNDVIAAVVDLMRSEIEFSGNSVSTDLDKEDIIINLDPDRFREVVFNILSNANIATAGGPITVRTYRDDGNIVLEIDDSGPGVIEEEMGRIFDPFFTTSSSGTGLGLAVTKRIVEENNGKITVWNKPTGDGAIFRVYLPVTGGIDEDSRG